MYGKGGCGGGGFGGVGGFYLGSRIYSTLTGSLSVYMRL